jgi:type II secretory pathway pseudopilin PulG
MFIQRAAQRRPAFTLVELLVVIAIMIAIAALAAAFMPRVQDSTQLSNAIDQLEQWLLTAKMRAKRDGLVTGVRLKDPNGTGMFTEGQYIQQPDPLSGGVCVGSTPVAGAYQYPSGSGNYYVGGLCIAGTTGSAQFAGVDFSLGGIPANDPVSGLPQWLVQPGDYLELRDGGGVHLITGVSANTLTVSPAQPIALAAPTTNYRILRQPRPLLGENPLQLPGNLAVDPSLSTVLKGVSGQVDVLFAPSGTVVGTNAGAGKIFLYVHDLTQNPVDPSRAGVVAVQTMTGYIGGYTAGPAGNPYLYAIEARGSGL